MPKLVNVLAAILTAAVLAMAADLFRIVLGINLYTEQYISGLLAIALPLVFLHVPASGKARRAPGPGPVVRPRLRDRRISELRLFVR